MRDKTIWKILGFLMVLVMIGSCMAMPSAGDVSANTTSGDKPDLIVSIAGPDLAIAGKNIDLEVTVRNVGSAPAPGCLDMEYCEAYCDVHLILSSDSNIPLELAVYPIPFSAGYFVEDMRLAWGYIYRNESIRPEDYVTSTLTTHIPKQTPPGIYCLGAVVDPGKAVDELNEDNNTYCHIINILPPEMADVKPPAGVDFYVMPYAVGGTPLYNINDSGLTDYMDIVDAPFGSHLGFRHAYDSRIPNEEIMYYRWLYKGQSETEWHEFTETVEVHYEKREDGVLTFPVYALGPNGVNGMNLYEFKPHEPPEDGTWPATDCFGDICSGFLNSEAISDGKYKIKLEIYDKKGNQVKPADSTFKFIVPKGADDDTIFTREATLGEVDAGGFVFALHIDNRQCSAIIDAPMIDTSVADECGFLRYTPPADENVTVHVAFNATHPDNFAIFTFSIIRGTEEIISANGEVSAYSVGDFSGDGNGNFENESSITKLLEGCREAAFSENLHVYAKATTGWGRITKFDAYAVRAFALSPP